MERLFRNACFLIAFVLMAAAFIVSRPLVKLGWMEDLDQ